VGQVVLKAGGVDKQQTYSRAESLLVAVDLNLNNYNPALVPVLAVLRMIASMAVFHVRHHPVVIAMVIVGHPLVNFGIPKLLE